MTYGVVSGLPVSASRVPSAEADMVSTLVSDTALACWVTCVAEVSALAGASCDALADGTNHRAPRRVPAAVAVSSGRRTDDTEYRSPCDAGELAVWGDVSERRGSQESHGRFPPYAP